MQLRHVRKVVQDNQHLIQFLISNFLDASVILRCCWMMRRSAGSSQSSQYACSCSVFTQILLDGNPAVVDGNGRTEDVNSLKDATGSEDSLLLYSGTGNSLNFPIPLFHLPNSKPGSRAASLSAHCDTAGR